MPGAIGDYRMIRMIGAGGMGAVYEAEEIESGQRVALKLIRAEFTDSSAAIDRFRREGKLAGTIQHPRCVFVMRVDEDCGCPYIVMELMPGKNLADHVEHEGPLSVTEAVAKILDVIEGLQEAHRLGMIHRDVKPSNCFLDEDGRVKVGDFGLAKSLVDNQSLTGSGSFLGTVLYASPEQIRSDNVNAQTDIYSVCATLYYLLTGQAPFSDKDAAACVARAVSEDAPSMRIHRPELPNTLDEVVRKGLARNRAVRYQSLEDLRLALLPFVAPPQSLGDQGWRVTAYLIDMLFLIPMELCLLWLWAQFAFIQHSGTVNLLVSLLVGVACCTVYFAIPEWLWGCSLGKFLTRLRVREVITQDRPGFWRSCWRTFLFVFFKDIVTLAVTLSFLALGIGLLVDDQTHGTTRVVFITILVSTLPLISTIIGFSILGVTMRRGNGFRAIHDLLSQTRVIRLPGKHSVLQVPVGKEWAKSSELALSLRKAKAVAERRQLPTGIPDQIGGFAIERCLYRDERMTILLAEDLCLERRVWLCLRKDTQELPAPRVDLDRATRPRWLAGGEYQQQVWDAFAASPGCLLADLVVTQRLNWREAARILEQLSQELTEAAEDGTTPAMVSLEQVWIGPGGGVQLLDYPLREPNSVTSEMEFLRRVAILALERKPRSSQQDAATPIQAPLPGYAGTLLANLHNAETGYRTPKQLNEALEQVRGWPVEISRPVRALQVAISAMGVALGLVCMFALSPALLLLTFVFGMRAQAVVKLQMEDCHLIRRHDVDVVNRMTQLQEMEPLLQNERQALIASWSGFVVQRLAEHEAGLRLGFEEQIRNGDLEEPITDLFPEGPRQPDEAPRGARDAASLFLGDPVWLGLFFVWPVLWALWAGLTRGGVVLRVAGIRLVDGKGRPASRWRCALRTFVLWLPIACLLALSLYLDLSRVANTHEAWMTAERAMISAWMSWHLWWAAVLIVVSYGFFAVYWPNRDARDWVAGTYSVPR
jgi:hypothetical protein